MPHGHSLITITVSITGGGHLHAPRSFGRAFAVGIGLNVAFVWSRPATASPPLDGAPRRRRAQPVGRARPRRRLDRRRALEAAALAGATPTASKARRSSPRCSTRCSCFSPSARSAGRRSCGCSTPRRSPAGRSWLVAAIGIVVNGFTAWLFASGRKGDLNIRGAYLHMAADAAVSAGVVVAGLVILVTGGSGSTRW